jgi:hypothetical protein
MAKATEDISNRTLATLLVVAIVISIGGTYVVLQRTPAITGLFTGTNATGTLTFEQQGVLSIKLNDAVASFGNVTSTSNGNCVVYTDGVTSAVNCSQSVTGDGMLLENDGNIRAKVRVNSSYGVDSMTLGTGGGQFYKASNSEGSSCSGTLTSTLTTLPAASDAMSIVCSNLGFADSADLLRIDYSLNIGTDLAPGNYSENVTFWAATDVS